MTMTIQWLLFVDCDVDVDYVDDHCDVDVDYVDYVDYVDDCDVDYVDVQLRVVLDRFDLRPLHHLLTMTGRTEENTLVLTPVS